MSEQQTGPSTDVTTRLTRSYGDKRVYATVYPNDIFGIGFNTRWGGYYFALSTRSAEGQR